MQLGVAVIQAQAYRYKQTIEGIFDTNFLIFTLDEEDPFFEQDSKDEIPNEDLEEKKVEEEKYGFQECSTREKYEHIVANLQTNQAYIELYQAQFIQIPLTPLLKYILKDNYTLGLLSL